MWVACSDDDAPENSPMTIRRQQKDAISQLVPAPCGTVEQPETECGNVPESSTARNGSHPAGDGADASRADVLSKPTLATQLVLGCYVATQKAAGGVETYCAVEPHYHQEDLRIATHRCRFR